MKGCSNCGNSFEPVSNRQKYCEDCRFIGKRCAVCGNAFQVKRGKKNSANAKYCSIKCRNSSEEYVGNLTKTFRENAGVPEHKCHVCQEWLEYDAFCKNAVNKNGLARICKKCEKKGQNENFFAYRIKVVKACSRKQGIFFDLSVEDIMDIWATQNGRCAISNRRLHLNAQIDHIIPVSKGGVTVKDNVRWLDPHINWARKNFTDEEFISMCKDVIDFQTGGAF
jgi:hypothetical protein